MGMAVAVALLAAPAKAEGDPERGREIFGQCAFCHDPPPDTKAPVAAPNLAGVIGRPAGSYPGFSYSEAMAARGADGLVWTEENLHAFVRDPRGFVPGTVMQFKGVRRSSMREDLFAYLRTLK
jgi:cytochrome c